MAGRMLLRAVVVIAVAAVLGYLLAGTGGLVAAVIIGPVVFSLAMLLARRRATKTRSTL